MEVNIEIVHPVGTARCNSHCSVLHQPSQHAAFGSSAHWLLQSPHLPMVRQNSLTTTTPLLITKGRQTNIPEKAPCTNDRSKCSPRSQLARCSMMRTSANWFYRQASVAITFFRLSCVFLFPSPQKVADSEQRFAQRF